MDGYLHSDTGKDSDIEVTLEDDNSSDDQQQQPTSTRTFTPKARSQTAQQVDDGQEQPYLPRLKTSIIQMVLNINSELIRLCQEYQNNSLMDDPQLIMYQNRLQTNLAYLASVADNYLDPTRNAPDLGPLPTPTLADSSRSTIEARLQDAREVYAKYVQAWNDRQLELSRRAKALLADEEKAQFASLDRENLNEQVVELLRNDRVSFDKSGDEPISPETYTPFPPFRLPAHTQLPPGVPRWTFNNSTAVPEDSKKSA
ncbi:hypothetical protein DL89DRAFT_267466 [Linderina pennispora]|uniref:SS18 N-terminal domain-containing protein n=1 Tax=Linderina pennispora TaxID=61395 RepID=A0A1Y1WAR7_9FUNG|nr:uncharacterized protein DL89DRAFT_267466 [Linderina pennispora]ORX70244.1 hypothetical protein DL89DRAFT_267466 [Linderina pennispora]